MSIQTTPTGLLGPAGMGAFERPGAASQKSAGVEWNFGSCCTAVTFHSPLGRGSCSLPVDTAAYIIVLPALSVTARSEVLLRTVTVVTAGLFGSVCRPGGGPTGATALATLGTLMVSPAAKAADGFSFFSSAGLA